MSVSGANYFNWSARAAISGVEDVSEVNSVTENNTQVASSGIQSTGVFGTTDTAQFPRSLGSADSSQPISTQGLPRLQQVDVSQPTASTSLEQLAIRNLLDQ